MRIEKVTASYAASEIRIKSIREREKQAAACQSQSMDSFEKSSGDHSALLNNIKNKIKSGYYNSEPVIDDLSDSFAKAFEKGL